MTQYALYVYTNATPSVLKFSNYVTPTCNASTCSYTPTLNLTAGNYKWQVRAGNTIGWSAYSAWLNFTASAPGAPTPQSPSGAVFNSNPTFTWTKLAGATKYALYVNTAANVNIFASYWFTAVCGTSTCSYTPLLNLTAGSYRWAVRAYNSLGWGAYSTWLNFSVSSTGSGFNSQFNGSKANWVTPAEDPTVWNVTPTYLYTSGTADHFTTIYYSQSGNEHFSSLDYSARLYRLGCDTCGNELIVRGEPTSISSYFDWNNAYYFGYTRNGDYSVWKCVSGSCGALQHATSTSAIVKGSAWNILRVTASGSTLKFYINDALVWTGTDTTFTTGHVGIDMYLDGSSGNTLYVDYATLTTTVSGAAESDVISADQAALNAAANQQVCKSSNRMMMLSTTPCKTTP